MPFLLNTCAISEFVAKRPDPRAVANLRALPPAETYLPTLTVGEIKQGIQKLPPGKRRSELEDWLINQLLPAYSRRIIPFGIPEALRWGELRALLRKNGIPMETEDSLVAATALLHGLTVVTRNETHFANCAVPVYNPWT